MTSRGEQLSYLQSHAFDVLVVGGGIVGAGIARDLALRGLSVALVEQRDLASGTTSRPTRLVHGGLRYLSQLDFGLVRTDLREREILLRVAPHLVFPLPFLMPLYDENPLYQAWLRTGMQLYDVLSFDKSLPSRRWLPRKELLAVEPNLDPDGLQGAWRFFDAQVPLVERLVVENALDASENGATVVTYARVERLVRDDGKVVGAVVRDLFSKESLEIRARLTVNATGPWLDLTASQLRTAQEPLLRLTKGVHLVTPPGSHTACVLFARRDGRLFFIVPWLDFSLVGTTDTDYRGDPGEVKATVEDVEYLVAEAKRAFPNAPFDTIYYTWAGVRALVRAEGVKEGEVSRKHAIYDHAARDGVGGIISVLGGKITAYRAIAEQVGRRAARRLGGRRGSVTAERPLPGGHGGDPTDLARTFAPVGRELALDPGTLEEVVRVHGSQAPQILTLVRNNRALGRTLCPHSATIAAQIVHAARAEWAETLGDAMLRRTTLGLAACQGLDCVDEVARLLGDVQGWDAAIRAAQVDAYRGELEPMRRYTTTLPAEVVAQARQA